MWKRRRRPGLPACSALSKTQDFRFAPQTTKVYRRTLCLWFSLFSFRDSKASDHELNVQLCTEKTKISNWTHLHWLKPQWNKTPSEGHWRTTLWGVVCITEGVGDECKFVFKLISLFTAGLWLLPCGRAAAINTKKTSQDLILCVFSLKCRAV